MEIGCFGVFLFLIGGFLLDIGVGGEVELGGGLEFWFVLD